MEQNRCIFCMQIIENPDHLCPVCKKGIWEYKWKENWLEPGTVLNGKYEVGAVLGEGTESVTYLGYDRTLEQIIVVKEYSFQIWEDKMEKTARLLYGNFCVQGLVIEKDFFLEGSKGYIVTEYLEGETLSARLAQRHTKMDLQEVKEILGPAMEAAAFLHSIGLIHQSINPEHLIFDSEGTLHLTAFGGQQKLQSPFRSPEQQTEKEGPWSDVYSICAVLYELITDKKVPPAVERIKKDRLKPPSVYTEIAPDGEAALMQGLSFAVQMRYFSVGGLAEALGMEVNDADRMDREIRRVWGEEWLGITAQTEASVYGTNVRGRRIRWKRIAAGILTVLVLLGIGDAFLQTHRELIYQYQIKKAAEEKKQNPRKRHLFRGDQGYDEIRSFVERYGKYEKLDSGDYFEHYSVPEAVITKCSALRGTYDTFYLEKDMMMDMIAYEMQLRKEDINKKDSMYYDTVHVNKDETETIDVWIWQSETYAMNYGNMEEKLNIDYDITDMQVKAIEFNGTKKRCEKFLEDVLPLVSPETYLTKAEAEEIMGGVNQELNYQGIDLTAKCRLIVSYHEMMEEGYSVALSSTVL